MSEPRTLRAPQRAIVGALDRHVLVSAGAGAGKTFTVVRALLHRLGVEEVAALNVWMAERVPDAIPKSRSS